MRTPIVLVGCGKSKRAEPSAARDLYTGSLFKARAAYADARTEHWWIISAGHGLVSPDEVLRPYDATMCDKSGLDRAAWALAVATALLTELADGTDLRGVLVELHAGDDYAEPLTGVLRELGISVSRPCKGLGIGEQRGWYADAARCLSLGIAPSGRGQ
jgi:hypothetical protein